MAVSQESNTLIAPVMDAYRTMLGARGNSTTITAALGNVGKVAAVDRVYIFAFTTEDDGTVLASQTHEWTSPQISPQIDNPDLQNIPMAAAGYGRWMRELQAYRPIVGAVASFPVEEHPLLVEQQILSILVLPIFANGTLIGMVGFDDCTRGREWSGADVDLLITTALGLGLALGETSPSSTERAIDTYLNLVARLLNLHQLMLSETSIERLLYRTRIRLQVLSQSYRFLVSAQCDQVVSLPRLLLELRPFFSSVQSFETDGEVEAIQLTVGRAMDVTIMLREILAVISDFKQDELSDALLSVSLHRRDGRAELTITARDRAGMPVGHGTELDAMAVALFRTLQENFDARLSTTGFDGLLFRLSFPL